MKSRIEKLILTTYGIRLKFFLITLLTLQTKAEEIRHNLPDNLEIIDPKSLGLSGSDLEKFLGNVKVLPIEGSLSGSLPKTQILTVGFDGNEQLNLQDFETISTAGLPEADKEVAELAFKKFQNFFQNPQSAKDFDESIRGGGATPVPMNENTLVTTTPRSSSTQKTIEVNHRQRIPAGKRPLFSSTFRSVPQESIETATHRYNRVLEKPIATSTEKQQYLFQNSDQKYFQPQGNFNFQIPTYQFNSVDDQVLPKSNFQHNYFNPPAAFTHQSDNAIHQLHVTIPTISTEGQQLHPHPTGIVLTEGNLNGLRASYQINQNLQQHQYPYVPKQQQFALPPSTRPFPSVKPYNGNSPQVLFNSQQHIQSADEQQSQLVAQGLMPQNVAQQYLLQPGTQGSHRHDFSQNPQSTTNQGNQAQYFAQGNPQLQNAVNSQQIFKDFQHFSINHQHKVKETEHTPETFQQKNRANQQNLTPNGYQPSHYDGSKSRLVENVKLHSGFRNNLKPLEKQIQNEHLRNQHLLGQSPAQHNSGSHASSLQHQMTQSFANKNSNSQPTRQQKQFRATPSPNYQQQYSTVQHTILPQVPETFNFQKFQNLQNQVGFVHSAIRPSQVDPLASNDLNQSVATKDYSTFPKQPKSYHRVVSSSANVYQAHAHHSRPMPQVPAPFPPKSIPMTGAIEIKPSTPLIPLSTVENAMKAHKSLAQMRSNDGVNDLPEQYREPSKNQLFPESIAVSEVTSKFQLQNHNHLTSQSIQHGHQRPKPINPTKPSYHRPFPYHPTPAPRPPHFLQDPIPNQQSPPSSYLIPEPSRFVSAPPPPPLADYSNVAHQSVPFNQGYNRNTLNFKEQKSVVPMRVFQGPRNQSSLPPPSPPSIYVPRQHQLRPHQELQLFPVAPPPPHIRYRHQHNINPFSQEYQNQLEENLRLHRETNDFSSGLGENIQAIKSAPLIGSFVA